MRKPQRDKCLESTRDVAITADILSWQLTIGNHWQVNWIAWHELPLEGYPWVGDLRERDSILRVPVTTVGDDILDKPLEKTKD